MIYGIWTGISFLLLFYACFCLLVKREQPEKIGEMLFLSVCIPSVGMIFLATLYTILEIYSITLVASSITLALVPLYLLALRQRKLLTPAKLFALVRSYRFSKMAILLLLTAMFLYFGFPTSYLAGGRDPGLYLINAIRVSETGSYQVAHDEYMSENFNEIKGFANLEYPGIYSEYDRGISDDPGDRTAQFLPMFPAALAVGYDLFGMQGLLLTNAYISVLALFAIYYFVQSFSSQIVAMIALIFMLVNPAQIWSARITQTEILAQLLVILALWSFSVFYRKRSLPAAVLAGALLGFSCINRIDMLVLGLGIYAITAFCAIVLPGQMIYSLISAGAYTIGAGLSVLYTYYFCYPYFMDLFDSKSLSGILFLNAGFAAVMLLLSLTRALFFRKKRGQEDLVSLRIYQNLIRISSLLLFLTFLFAYFLRPIISGQQIGTQGYFVANAMAEFCFYTSFLAVPMAVFGMYRLLMSKKRETESLFLFFLTGLASLIGYIYRPSIVFDHIWASRRWISVAIPFVMILAAYSIPEIAYALCSLMYRLRRKGLGETGNESGRSESAELKMQRFLNPQFVIIVALSLILAGFGLYQTRAFLFVRMLDKMESGYEELADALDDKTVYYTQNSQIASVLRYVYGENVYMIRDKEKAIIEYVRRDEAFFYIGEPLLQDRFDLDLENRLLSEHQIEGLYLERAYNDYPDSTYQWSIPADIYALVNTGSNQKDLNLDALALYNGTRDELGISSGQTPGWVFFGPYDMIRKGTYTVTIEADLITAAGDEIMKLDVVGNGAQSVFGEAMVRRSDFSTEGKAKIVFTILIPETCLDFELRCLSVDGASFRVTRIHFQREKSNAGS